MAVLNIRNLPDAVHRRLRVRAAQAGRSMEAEARDILTRTCLDAEAGKSASTLPDWVDEIYGKTKPDKVVDELIAERRRESAAE